MDDEPSVNRLAPTLLVVILVAVLGLGVVVWRADEAARADRRRSLCLERAQATATIALLVPRSQIDEQGRLDAVETLGNQVDAC